MNINIVSLLLLIIILVCTYYYLQTNNIINLTPLPPFINNILNILFTDMDSIRPSQEEDRR